MSLDHLWTSILSQSSLVHDKNTSKISVRVSRSVLFWPLVRFLSDEKMAHWQRVADSQTYAKPISEAGVRVGSFNHQSLPSIAINTKHKSSHVYFRQRMQYIPNGYALCRPDAVYSDRM